MGKVKDIRLKVIPHKIANKFVRRHHYSGTYSRKSNLHFGVFLDNSLHGVMQYGSPIDKNKVIDLVKDTRWNGMIELHRIDRKSTRLNSSHVAISYAVFCLKKKIKWII